MIIPTLSRESTAVAMEYGRGVARTMVDELARAWSIEADNYVSNGMGDGMAAITLDDEDRAALVIAELVDESWSRKPWRSDEYPPSSLADVDYFRGAYIDTAAVTIRWDDRGFVYLSPWVTEDGAKRECDVWQAENHDCECDCPECLPEDDGTCDTHGLPRDDGHDAACHPRGAAFGDLLEELRYAEGFDQ